MAGWQFSLAAFAILLSLLRTGQPDVLTLSAPPGAAQGSGKPGEMGECCGKAKEFEQHGKNVKRNNRISGAVWTVGTGNAEGRLWYLLSSLEL